MRERERERESGPRTVLQLAQLNCARERPPVVLGALDDEYGPQVVVRKIDEVLCLGPVGTGQADKFRLVKVK